MSSLLAPLELEFIRSAVLTGSAVAVVCALLSCFVILKGWSLMGDAVSHAVLPGIVLAYLAGWPLAAGAFIAGLACSGAAGYIRQHSRIREDTVLGVVFTGLFALGLVLHSKTHSDLHLDHILFGSLLGIESGSALQYQVLGTAAATALVLLALRRDLLLVCFDPVQARVTGLRVPFLSWLLLTLLVLAIVTSIQAVGIILVTAMLITPGCTAYLWTDRFDRMLVISSLTAAASTAAGILASFHWDTDTAASIVMAQSLVFAFSFLLAPGHGWLALHRRRNRQKRNSGFPSAST